MCNYYVMKRKEKKRKEKKRAKISQTLATYCLINVDAIFALKCIALRTDRAIRGIYCESN